MDDFLYIYFFFSGKFFLDYFPSLGFCIHVLPIIFHYEKIHRMKSRRSADLICIPISLGAFIVHLERNLVSVFFRPSIFSPLL